MIAIYFEHFFEPLIGQQTFLKAYLTAQKSCVKLLSNYLRAQKSGFNLLSAFLSEFFFLSALLSTQKHTQGTSEPLWVCPNNTPSLIFFVGEAAFTFILGSFYIDVDALESSLLSQKVISIFEDLWILSVLGLDWNNTSQTSHH